VDVTLQAAKKRRGWHSFLNVWVWLRVGCEGASAIRSGVNSCDHILGTDGTQQGKPDCEYSKRSS
jgi:hypothetical protein